MGADVGRGKDAVIVGGDVPPGPPGNAGTIPGVGPPGSMKKRKSKLLRGAIAGLEAH
jgi:hypothetical protein